MSPNNPASPTAGMTPPQTGQGLLRGNERFLRGNRSRRDFVGADRAEQTSFVGAQQALASGRVRPATEGLRIETTNPRTINRPLGPLPARGMYYPKLEIDSPSTADSAQSLSRRETTLKTRLEQRIERLAGPGVQVAIEGSTATLSGSVDSERLAELLMELLRFEPGIDEVRNGLRIGTRSRSF